ncbi:aldose 1-epimerase [Cohaesibacter sp. ES.047]|uniref:aldose epimerase family protein n=1 Tax=Cohaesibacter sp. ES.047 TaxID=1798205 RepID=UPI000BB9BC46|nr:aldose epimerase family protein [Cohaesibacter sp. ES.047]SNY91252.1 aldose 1-epimerase [Cohaesibacter sp. ES.047]
MSKERFGEMPDGTPIDCITISGGGLTAKVLTYGAIIQDLRLEGHDKALVLGYETLEPYLTDSPYFGATVGRVGNRIRDGHLEIDGKTYQLDINFVGKHTLHGGTVGMSQKVWRVEWIKPDAVQLSVELPDGEMGFPGTLSIVQTYSLKEGGVLDLDLTAHTDKTTVCNLAHHSYFNLDGSATIHDHVLQVNGDRYTVSDEECIPSGEIASLDGHPLDFRKPKRVGDVIAITSIIDNNICCEEGAGTLRKLAALSSPKSGVSVEVMSTEPGLQIYDGIHIKTDVPGLDGFKMGTNAAFCMEPQIWPDAVHHANFPQPILRPGETYHQHTQYVFSKA